MKTKKWMLLLVAALVMGFAASCSSEDDSKKDDNGDNGGDGGEVTEYPSLKGSNYYLIVMDETTKAKIASKVTKDYRVDDQKVLLNIWPDGTTYSQGTSSGPNFYGEIETWVSLQVASGKEWSGAGFFSNNVDLTGVTRDYTLHLGMKSKDTKPHVFIVTDGSNEVRVCIGTDPFVDNGTQFPAYKDFKRNGEWQEVEIPMSYFFDKGINFRNPYSGNILGFISGNVAGTALNLDAVFIYKK